MGEGIINLVSLDRVGERIIDHLQQGHSTALIGSPGSGITTYLKTLTKQIAKSGFEVIYLDFGIPAWSEFIGQLNSLQPAQNQPRVIVLDHASSLLADDFKLCLETVHRKATETKSLCLWCGPLDARSIDRDFRIKICSVPSAHVSFPMLLRDEQLSVYKAISEQNDCHWGEAILYLMLDFCGNDFSLVAGATDYFHGDWSDKLYDESIWDRLKHWFDNDEVINSYRLRLKNLPRDCQDIITLVRFGGKPTCHRIEVLEEQDDALRILCLNGFLVQNLLPGFYQLRNLTVRSLLDDSIQPETLFRRATNERTGQLLQDAETMLRHVLKWAFERIGPESVRERLERMPRQGEIISSDLNRELLKWAKQSCSEEKQTDLDAILLEHRKAFRISNSVWAGITQLMKDDGMVEATDPRLTYLKYTDYMTFNELGTLAVDLLDKLFPRITDDVKKKRLKDRWLESISKIRRLRNQIAHLRNVSFQDMQDLVGTIEGMRQDIINDGGWKYE